MSDMWGLQQALMQAQAGSYYNPYSTAMWPSQSTTYTAPNTYTYYTSPPAIPEPKVTMSKPKMLHNCTFHELLDAFDDLVARF